MKWPTHGANPHYLYKSLQLSLPEKYIDFSHNVNPFGVPNFIRDKWSEWLSVIETYPDPLAQSFTETLAEKIGVTNDWILVGNGGAELISLLGRLFRKKRVMIVQPAFSEYETACQSNDCQVFYHQLQADNWRLSPKQVISQVENIHAEALFLCTPNNPTGVVFDETAVLEIVHACQQRKITVVIDEAFYDFYQPTRSFATYILQYPNLVILRSLTKMYAIPGLRLGYAIAHPEIIQKLANYQPHWSVNGIALQAGQACVVHSDHVYQTIHYINEERQRLFQFFKDNHFIFSKSQVNFYLLRDRFNDDPLQLFRFLLEKGIVPRHTANFPGLDGRWLRFAVKLKHENDLLLEALAEWRRRH